MNFDDISARFADAAVDLSDALVQRLEGEDPNLTAKVAQALQRGERLVLSMEFDQVAPVIRLATLDDYGTRKEVMHVAGVTPGRQ
jgi:hypothetical protein